MSRRRVFTVFVDRACGRFIADPASVYRALCDGLSNRHLTLEELSKLGTLDDLKREIAQSGKSLDGYPDSYLNEFEQKNKAKYEDMLVKKNHDDSSEHHSFCLDQNPTRCSKLNVAGILPLFTKSDKNIWLTNRRKHLLAIEKFAAHGYGVNKELATMLGTPVPCEPISSHCAFCL